MIRYLGAICCFIALFCHAMQTYHRAGNPVVKAVVVGFGKPHHALFKSSANLKVRFELNGKEYIATTIESVSADRDRKFDHHLDKEVEVHVNEKDPGIVSVRGDHSLDISCALLFLLGFSSLFFFR